MILRTNTFSYARCWSFIAQTSSTNYLAKINPELFDFFMPVAGCWDRSIEWSSLNSSNYSECWSAGI